jgi:FMN phosphatase YigB (HAD superfamily)
MVAIRAIIWDLGDTLIGAPPGGQDKRPLDSYGELALRPDAASVLARMNRLGYRQAVLSNTAVSDTASVKRLLTRLGVAHYFSAMLATQSERDPSRPGKPDAWVFQQVLADLGMTAGEAVMVGNSWAHDIRGANGVGMASIFLTNPAISQSPPVRANLEDEGLQSALIWTAYDLNQVERTLRDIASCEAHKDL